MNGETPMPTHIKKKMFLSLACCPEKLQPLREHEGDLPSVGPPLLPQHRVGLHIFKKLQSEDNTVCLTILAVMISVHCSVL